MSSCCSTSWRGHIILIFSLSCLIFVPLLFHGSLLWSLPESPRMLTLTLLWNSGQSPFLHFSLDTTTELTFCVSDHLCVFILSDFNVSQAKLNTLSIVYTCSLHVFWSGRHHLTELGQTVTYKFIPYPISSKFFYFSLFCFLCFMLCTPSVPRLAQS